MFNEPIKIQTGNIYINKTKKYFLPIVKIYGKTFVSNIEQLNKLAVGIGDIICEKSNIKYDKHLFILIDSENTKTFIPLLKFFQNHESYENDYAFDVLHIGKLHMLVLKIPHKYHESILSFKASLYSQMYSMNDINMLFIPESKYEDIRKVLIHDISYKMEFITEMCDFFNINENDYINTMSDYAEYDFPYSEVEENFNTHLKN